MGSERLVALKRLGNREFAAMSEQATESGVGPATVIYSGEYGSRPDVPAPSVFIQWKGTNACLDFHCKCGAHHHVDAMFVYALKCSACNQIYVMPSTVALKPVETFEGCIHVCEPEVDL